MLIVQRGLANTVPSGIWDEFTKEIGSDPSSTPPTGNPRSVGKTKNSSQESENSHDTKWTSYGSRPQAKKDKSVSEVSTPPAVTPYNTRLKRKYLEASFGLQKLAFAACIVNQETPEPDVEIMATKKVGKDRVSREMQRQNRQRKKGKNVVSKTSSKE